jgi:hypothetical protein
VAEAAACDVLSVVDELLYRLFRGHELALQFSGLVILDPFPGVVGVTPAYKRTLAFIKYFHWSYPFLSMD